MTKGPICIEDTNLSRAWARAFLAVCERGVEEIVPLVVTVTGFADARPAEDPLIQAAVDAALRATGKRSIRTVANTIFPRSMWNPAADQEQLYVRYLKALPRLRRADAANKYGLYFERMIAYQPKGAAEPVNQLRHIIGTRAAGNPRRSALQLATFDPTHDHTNQRLRGFPCLHQVAFSPMGEGKRELAVTGLYATQYLFEKGYGNYLGLCELGAFVAHELGLELKRMTCVAAVAELGVSKASCAVLARELSRLLEPTRAEVAVGDQENR